jgi:phage protein D
MPDNVGIQVARPNITVGGQDRPSLVEGMLGLVIVENTSGLYRCEALFGNWGPRNGDIGFLYFDRGTLDWGKAFQVKLGTDVLFDGRIMGLEAQFPEGRPPALNVLAEDRFQDLRMTRRTRTFDDMSDADVFNRIANDHGLSPDVSVNGPTRQVLAQVNQSDLAFMRARARSIDAEVWIEGRTLNVKSHANRGGATLQMTYSHQLREFSVLADLAGQRTSVTVSGWDVSSKDGIKHEATESVISGELDGGASGASTLSSAIGERKDLIAHTVPLTAQEAQAEAEAVFKMTARRFVVGRGVAEPNAQLHVGVKVDLAGLGPLFSGKYYVSEVKHVFDATRGLRTEFTAERPGLGQAG